MQQISPFIRVSHVQADAAGRIEALGNIHGGRVTWQLSAAAVVALYRAGSRFFMLDADGKSLEIFVFDDVVSLTPQLRTTGDRTFVRKLLELPRLGDGTPLSA